MHVQLTQTNKYIDTKRIEQEAPHIHVAIE